MSTATNLPEETMPKKEFQNVQLQQVNHSGGLRLALNSFAELEKFSHFMALSNFVPKHLRGKQADCLAVLLQSMRWEMDPFAVAQKTYFVNDGMAYEAQLVNAIILSRAPLKTRPKLSWAGEGDNLTCTASATFIGEDDPTEFTAEIKTITTKNSPLWKQQPKQQLGYFALRAWARLYCPDVLMGVYTKEEREDSSMNIGPDNAIDITPSKEAQSAIEDIQAGIVAEKEAEKQPAHDKETGEILEAAPEGEKPCRIPARVLPGDATATDWDSWVTDWEQAVKGMATADDLGKLQKMNHPVLNSLQKINPPKFNHCMEAFENRGRELGEAVAA